MTVGSTSTTSPSTGSFDRRRFVLLGSAVSIGCDRPERLDRLAGLLAPFACVDAAATPVTASFTVADDGGSVVTRSSAGEVRSHGSWHAAEAHLLAALNALALAGYTGLAVHAGVVARAGRAICFPAVSGAGKSTLTAACLHAGFEYVSDEALCIDRVTGAVDPYPRPLALSATSCRLLGEAARLVATRPPSDVDADAAGAEREIIVVPGDLGATVADGTVPLRLGDVVELTRGAAELHLEPVHRARVVPALLSMSFNHYKEPDTSVAVVAALARSVRVWRLHYDDPVAAAELLARELS